MAAGLARFFGRNQRMVAAEVTERRFDAITDPGVRALPARLGTVEQWAVRHDVVFRLERRPAIHAAYDRWMRTAGVMPSG